MKKYALLLGVLLFFSINAFADIRLPDKPTPRKTPVAKKETSVELNIRINPNLDEPVLRIPRSAIKTLRAEIDDADSTGNAMLAATNAKIPTLVSGLFLSLAIIFGGVWLARGKNLGKNGKLAASGLVIVFFSAAFAFTIYANVAPPPFQGLNGSIFTDTMKNHWRGAVGKVKVEITDEDDKGAPIELMIPRDGKDKAKSDEE